jgi:hypothetical protein
MAYVFGSLPIHESFGIVPYEKPKQRRLNFFNIFWVVAKVMRDSNFSQKNGIKKFSIV